MNFGTPQKTPKNFTGMFNGPVQLWAPCSIQLYHPLMASMFTGQIPLIDH